MFCLDTNIVIYYQNNHPKVVQKLLSVPDSNICITHITVAELYYGVFKSKLQNYNLENLNDFLNEIKIVNSSYESDKIFVVQKAISRKSRNVIADLDLIIASICLANKLILVTNNTKHFENINGLKLEDWTRLE